MDKLFEKLKKPSRTVIIVTLLVLLSIGFAACTFTDGASPTSFNEPSPTYTPEYPNEKQNDHMLSMELPPYEAQEWLNYYMDEKMPWDGSLDIELLEYPHTVFRWTPYEITAIDSNGEKILFTGMPIWNVYLADLTGDGLPEFCATVSIGSGIADQRIIVYDYATDKTYDLNDRFFYDYMLYLDNGCLMVKQTKHSNSGNNIPVIASGKLALVDGMLTAIGIDRTIPTFEPKETTPPAPPKTAESTLHEAFYQVVLKLYEMDAGLNSEIEYIAVDMTGVFENERASLEAKLRVWAESLGCELLVNTYEELVASGHILPLPSKDEPFPEGYRPGFQDGILFGFNEGSFDGNTLTIKADKYRTPLGAVGSEFTARFVDGNWIVDEPDSVWMA